MIKMKKYIIYLLVLLGCDKNKVIQNINQSMERETISYSENFDRDTTSIGVLVHKKNKTLEDDLLMLKNTAFCFCINEETKKIIKYSPNKYSPIPDNSISGYMEFSTYLDAELFVNNKKVDSLVKLWSNKKYATKPPENPEDKAYLIYMKCLDFYNSDI